MTTYKLQALTGHAVTVPSVTTITKRTMASPALERWKLAQVAAFTEHCESAEKGLAAFWATHEAADRGSAVHQLIRLHLQDGIVTPLPGPLAPYYAAFVTWTRDNWTVLAHTLVEQTLLSDDGTVAGTADLITDGGLLVDWKTSEKCSDGPAWPDQLVQVGAYSSMRRLVVDGKATGTLAPKINEARVVRLCGDGGYHEHILSDDPRRVGQLKAEGHHASKLSDAKRAWLYVEALDEYVRSCGE